MHQLTVRARRSNPANMGTADCALICFCDDGSDYAVKDQNSGLYVCHSEWFCKHLGDSVGIASPECRLVEIKGEVAFGSRWESGHSPDDWWLRARSGDIEMDRISPVLSRIFAFDLFVNNEDRHGTNYIVRQQANQAWSILAFDYSRAWFAAGWPLCKPPMDSTTNTRDTFTKLNSMLGGFFDLTEALFVINALRNVKVDRIEQILNSQHISWLSKKERDAIVNFWQSSSFDERLNQIEEGLTNGDYV